MNDSIEFMRNVAKEIMEIKITKTSTLNKAKKDFYKIMIKYGIKRFTKVENGLQGDNFEWTMARTLFESKLNSFWVFETMLEQLPKTLESY